MKFFAIFAAFSLAFSGVQSAMTGSDIDAAFNEFKVNFNKVYAHSDEEAMRKNIFIENLKFIEAHNTRHLAGEKSYSVGVNQFADMTNEEFRLRNGFKRHRDSHSPSTHENSDVNALPATVDWTTKGVVTPVKDQEQCGSCWAFSAVASIEGQHALKTGKLVSLSEQNLVDCSGPEGDMGCGGGWMDYAFQYVIDAKGIDTEKSYPYEGVDDTCRFNKKNIGATISSFVDIPTGDEKALQNAVATVGPISVAIDASQMSFQFYKSGIYDEPNCSSDFLDHGVTAVGYGTDNGVDYWKVKNSWNTSWGEKGYIQMSRNKNNQCGIATKASYPVV